MPEFLTTRELADLLRIKERKVYDLATSGEVPVSRAMGKLLFPRAAIDAWLARNSSGVAVATTVRAPVVAGSHDPLLEWALRESRAGLATLFDGSLDGLERFAGNQAIATALHVYEPVAGHWNTHLIANRFAAAPVVLLEFAWRQRGLVVAPERQHKFEQMQALRGQRVVPRQPEAGSQVLFEHLLARAKVGVEELVFTPSARTESDAVLAVVNGKADVAFGLQGLAQQYGLGFVPLLRERFDLLVDRRAWFEPELQRLFEFGRSQALAHKASELGGYDVGGFGRVHFNGA
jgi:putative molybdopterin biosynthesis protein